MTPSRENILARVRAALRVQAHRPPAPTSAPIFPPVTNPEARFREEFIALKGELIESAEKLREFLKPFTKIAADGNELVRRALADAGRGSDPAVAWIATVEGESRQECRSHIFNDTDLGVTSCDCLIAQTGSIVVSALSTGGRAISVLPPAHLVIARRDQIVPDLASGMTLLRQRYDRHWPSTLSLITGPSRTADIEKILVFGAHGPKRLAVYFAD